jgi:MFS family permease
LLAFVLLLIGGLGTAAFSNMQTTLILTEAPPATRSRVMGIVTMCIGTGPVGVVMIGILSGLCGLSLVWRRLIRVHPYRTTHGVMC